MVKAESLDRCPLADQIGDGVRASNKGVGMARQRQIGDASEDDGPAMETGCA